jgi:hypothetical protein
MNGRPRSEAWLRNARGVRHRIGRPSRGDLSGCFPRRAGKAAFQSAGFNTICSAPRAMACCRFDGATRVRSSCNSSTAGVSPTVPLCRRQPGRHKLLPLCDRCAAQVAALARQLRNEPLEVGRLLSFPLLFTALFTHRFFERLFPNRRIFSGGSVL